MIHFTSDLHAFHKNIIAYDNLPFGSLEEYRGHIIKTWNDKVKEEDEVYLLGDTCVGGRNKEIKEFLESLNGIKYLVKGNHEKEIMNTSYLRDMFVWIKDYYLLDYEKKRFVLFHYPIESWQNRSHGSIHIHGHSHGKSLNIKNRIDVGFNQVGVISIEEIINSLNNKNNYEIS